MDRVKTLIAFRHGEYPLNQRIDLQGDEAYAALKVQLAGDIDYQMGLNDKGRVQAETLRQVLSSVAIDACLSSPYLRTVTTAGIVFAERDMYSDVDSNLRERNLGFFRDIPRKVFREQYEDEYKEKQAHPLDWVPRDGESLRRVGRRALEAVWRADSLAPNGTVAFSTHADTMVALRSLPELANLSEEQLKQPLTLELQNPQWIQNCQLDIYTREDPYRGDTFNDMSFFRSIAIEGSEAEYDTGWLSIAR